MRELKLKIFEIKVICHCADKVYERLSKDFHFFISDYNDDQALFSFSFYLTVPPWEKLNKLECLKQSVNSMTYKNGNNILNDYYGVALSILNLDSHDALVYSENLERLYEIAYLLILSRTGKLMDSNGFHKIHAFGLAFEDMAYIAMMPSKGGKTTLFLDLISSNKNFEMISDDTPVCDMRGNIYSFPLRIGVEPTHNIPDDLLKHSYTIDRLQYGKKILIPLNVFPNLFSRIKSKSTIFTCRRIYDKSCRIEKSSTLATFKDLQKHMVIGIGLPMILEYFLESNLLDFFRLSFIFLRRLISSLVLSIKSKNYIVYLGTDLELNYSTMEDFIKEKK